MPRKAPHRLPAGGQRWPSITRDVMAWGRRPHVASAPWWRHEDRVATGRGGGDGHGAPSVFVPLRLRLGGRELAFFSTVATFGTPLDITVAELSIESFFPADADTAAELRARATC
jgi:MmyB-like transcription regulator ligand binding domain